MWSVQNSLALLVKYKLMKPLWKTIWLFFKQLNVELQNDSAVLLLGIYSKELRTYFHTKAYTLIFKEALFVAPK